VVPTEGSIYSDERVSISAFFSFNGVFDFFLKKVFFFRAHYILFFNLLNFSKLCIVNDALLISFSATN
jgi:hypothetical protein